jgi:hypothetical protein
MDIASAFEWTRNERSAIYQSRTLAFKIKKEKVDFPYQAAERFAYEVFIADDKQKRLWRPLRLFPCERAIADVMRWVESFAARLAERQESAD